MRHKDDDLLGEGHECQLLVVGLRERHPGIRVWLVWVDREALVKLHRWIRRWLCWGRLESPAVIQIASEDGNTKDREQQ